MKMKKIFFILLMSLMANPVFAFDWQKVYNQAARTESFDAGERIKREPDSIEALALLGFVYLNEGEFDKASVVFNEIVKRQPDAYQAKWGLAEIMTRQGRLEEARKELSNIVSEHGDFTPAVLSMAYLKFNAKEYNEAFEITEKLLVKGQDEAYGDVYLRSYLMWASMRGIAIQNGGAEIKYIYAQCVLPAMAKARNYITPDAQSYFGLGVFFLTAPAYAGGDVDKALGYLQEALKLKPDWADCYARIAQAHQAKGNAKTFKKNLDKALVIEPENKTALDAKAMIGDFTFIADK